MYSDTVVPVPTFNSHTVLPLQISGILYSFQGSSKMAGEMTQWVKGPEFNAWDTHGERRELTLTPASSPLTPHVLWSACICTYHTHTKDIIKILRTVRAEETIQLVKCPLHIH